MNNEVIKAMNKKEKFSSIRKWWTKHRRTVLKVVLFPIWFTVENIEKINQKLDARETWSDERAKEIFDYYVPRFCEWDKEEKAFYFSTNYLGWNKTFTKKYLKRKDRRFWEVHNGLYGGRLRNYLIKEFELDGFQKEVGNCADGWTEISFTLIEK